MCGAYIIQPETYKLHSLDCWNKMWRWIGLVQCRYLNFLSTLKKGISVWRENDWRLQHVELATIIFIFNTHTRMKRRQQIRGGTGKVMDRLRSPVQPNTQHQYKYRFSVCIELLHYWLWVINYGYNLLRGITVQHHKEMSSRLAEPSCTTWLSLAFVSPCFIIDQPISYWYWW